MPIGAVRRNELWLPRSSKRMKSCIGHACHNTPRALETAASRSIISQPHAGECYSSLPSRDERRKKLGMDIDLYDASFQEDPYPAYAWLRAEAPVYREPRYGAFVVTRYQDVADVLRDHETFSSAAGPAPMPTPGGGLPLLVATDPPYHDQLRGLVNRAFTPRRVAESAPGIRARAKELVAEIPSDREFDLVTALSIPLPVAVIAEMLGVPKERQPDFRRWSDAFVGLLENPPNAEMIQATGELLTFFHALEDERRKAPGNDLVSGLMEAELDGRRLTSEELDAFFIMLLVAGNETTTNLISNQIRLLSERPELWKALREDRSLLAPAIEETVRWDSPVQNLGREVTRKVELHGVSIDVGERVVISFGAANHDEDGFEAADEYRIDRTEGRHLGFGQGRHFCLGAGLARLEAEAALDAMLDRFESIEIGAHRPQRLHSTVIRGFESLTICAA
jgi:cytochrome P450